MSPGRLVLVDDEPAILELLGSLFRDKNDWQVSAFGRGSDAMERLRSAPFDVLLTDKNLPDMGGLDLIAEARRLDPDSEAILITGYASLETAVQAIQLGAFDYIVKPPPSIFDIRRKVDGAMAKVRLARENRQLVADLKRKNAELEAALDDNRRVQAELVQSEKLAGIGTLAAGIAHEISSPLFGVMGLAEAIQDETEGDVRRYAGEIVEYARSIKEIVVQLRGYARSSERDDVTLVPAAGVVADAVKLVVRTLALVEGQVVASVPEDLTVRAKASELQQVLVNLVKNAVEAVEEHHGEHGGHVRVSARRDADHVVFSVQDDGPGIPADRQREIFDPFYTTKPAGKGTGLGLNIVWRLVARHGGTVTVESVVGEGTTFHVRLPAAA